MKTIDVIDIDKIVQESEYDVVNSLLDEYDKAYMIIENYEGDDLTAFSVFQESQIIMEASKQKQIQKTIDSAPGFVPDKPEFKFRQNKKNGDKESVLKSIWMVIPRLFKMVKETYKRNMEIKRLKYINDEAKKLGVSIKNMDNGQLELFYAMCTQKMDPSEIRKIISKENWNTEVKKVLVKNGLKIGGGAIVVGGIAYELSKDNSIIKTKVDEFKGNIAKKLDDNVFGKLRNIGDDIATKINDAGDKVVTKISQISEAVVNAIKTAIENIRKVYEVIKKFFNVNIFGYEKTSDENVVCKYDPRNGQLHVTLDLNILTQWADKSAKFIQQAALFVSKSVDGDKIVDTGKKRREGAITQFEKDKAAETNPVAKQLLLDAEGAVKKYNEELQSIMTTSNKKYVYSPMDEFTQGAEKLSKSLDKINTVSDQLIKLYENRTTNHPNDPRWSNAEKAVLNTLRGIFDTQFNIQKSIGAVNEYIDRIAEMSKAMSIDETE